MGGPERGRGHSTHPDRYCSRLSPQRGAAGTRISIDRCCTHSRISPDCCTLLAKAIPLGQKHPRRYCQMSLVAQSTLTCIAALPRMHMSVHGGHSGSAGVALIDELGVLAGSKK